MDSQQKTTTGEILDFLLGEIRTHLLKEGAFLNNSLVFSGVQMRMEANIVLFGRVAKDVYTIEGQVGMGTQDDPAEELEPITIEVEKRKPGRLKKLAVGPREVHAESGVVIGREG